MQLVETLNYLQPKLRWREKEAKRGMECYHTSRVCYHGTDQSDRRTNIARFCDLTCTLDLYDRNLLCQQRISWFEPCDIANFRPRADICNLAWLKPEGRFLSFYRVQKISLRVLSFRGLPVRVEFQFHDDKHNPALGLPCQCGPRAAVVGRNLI